MTRRVLILTSFLMALSGWAVAGESPGSGTPVPPLGWGVALDGFHSELSLSLSDLEGVDWQGNPVTGQATEDTDENTDYSTQRTYWGLKGFLEVKPLPQLKLTGFVRGGLIREIFHGKHAEGSYFVDWGDRPETDTVSFGQGFLMGFGAGATYSIQQIRIVAETSLNYDAVSYKNQRWFTMRSDGSLTIVTYDLRVGVGYDLGFVTPRAQLGFLVYAADGEFDQILQNMGRNDHYEASFSAWTPITFTLGADFEGEDHLVASLDLILIGEYALRFSVGLRF
ncbi:MAG: hypothetical protein ACYTHM_21770 [Planctomycetota bacterium]|jgi:hypothetical protein